MFCNLGCVEGITVLAAITPVHHVATIEPCPYDYCKTDSNETSLPPKGYSSRSSEERKSEWLYQILISNKIFV
jgi:hypothetical protein